MRRDWMPLYIRDFLADTMHLSNAETGAYMRLIMDYWLHDGLPDDDTKLAKIARVSPSQWRSIGPILEAFFLPGWKHKKIDHLIANLIEQTIKKRAAASKAGQVSAYRRATIHLVKTVHGASPTFVENTGQFANETCTSRAPLNTSKKESTTTVNEDRAKGSPPSEYRGTPITKPSPEIAAILEKSRRVQP